MIFKPVSMKLIEQQATKIKNSINLAKENYLMTSYTNWYFRFAVALALGILALYFFPLFYYQENAVIRIHDNLEGIMYFYHAAKPENLFVLNPENPVAEVMNGLPRGCLPSGLNIVVWCFATGGPFWGYVVNYTIVHLIGFVGMYLLLKNHFLKDNHIIALFVSLSFSLLPVFPLYGISLMGQPLLLNAFLNIRSARTTRSDYFVIILFAFYSSVFYSGIFIVGALLIWVGYDFLKTTRINYKFLWGILLLFFCYCVIEYQLIYLTFLSDTFTSHREQYERYTTLNWKGVIGVASLKLINGDYGSSSYSGAMIMLLTVIAFALNFWKKEKIYSLQLLFCLSILTAFFTVIWDWHGLKFIYENTNIFNQFNYKRIHFLLPLFVFLCFALSLKYLQKFSYLKHISIALLMINIILLFKLNSDFHDEGNKTITFRNFFSESIFKKINLYMNRPQNSYRVGNIGISPGVAQYNGFYTFDSYQTNYPLSHKLLMGRVMEKELDKSENLKTFFVGWANRCYIYSSELYEAEKDNRSIDKINIHLNASILKQMNCSYLFSAVEITNPESSNLVLEQLFTDSASMYNKIYLYKLQP